MLIHFVTLNGYERKPEFEPKPSLNRSFDPRVCEIMALDVFKMFYTVILTYF